MNAAVTATERDARLSLQWGRPRRHESASVFRAAQTTRTPAASSRATASAGAEESVTTTSRAVASHTTAIAVRTNSDPSTIAITRARGAQRGAFDARVVQIERGHTPVGVESPTGQQHGVEPQCGQVVLDHRPDHRQFMRPDGPTGQQHRHPFGGGSTPIALTDSGITVTCRWRISCAAANPVVPLSRTTDSPSVIDPTADGRDTALGFADIRVPASQRAVRHHAAAR